MARGRLIPPRLDDRNWQEIRDQVVKLIGQNCPTWTDRGPSDPGIAIVEMFAWLVEGMIWRLDQVPERNYVEFLNLMGITRDPAVPASNWLTFTNSTSASKATVAAGTQAGTIESASQAAIIFETDETLDIWPGELNQAWLLSDSAVSSSAYQDIVRQVAKSPLKGLDVVLPLNTSGSDAGRTANLLLGFTVPPPAGEIFSVHLQIANFEGEPNTLPSEQFEREITTEYSGGDVPIKTLPMQSDQTNGLRQSGRISWKSPSDWKSVRRTELNGEPLPQPPDEPLFWLRFRIGAKLIVPLASPTTARPRIRLEHLLYNSVPATNALTYHNPVNAQADLISNGQPFQFLELAFRPLYKRPSPHFAYDHVVIKVSAPGQSREDAVTWTVVSELTSGPVTNVQVNGVAGTIEFGDGTRGLIPPEGSQVWVESYRYVAGGSVGNVAPDTVRLLQRPIEKIMAVTNPGVGHSGVDEEDIETTKLRAPRSLKTRDRAVTTADFEYLAREASNRVQKVRCLTPSTSQETVSGRLNRGEGHLNVLIVPNDPGPRPGPQWDLIREVQDHLDARRMVTTRVHVVAPRYVPIIVAVKFRLFPPPPGGAARTKNFGPNLEQALRDAVDSYLHPLTGRPTAPGLKDGQGWEIGQSLFVFELFDHLKTVLGREGYLTEMKVVREFAAEVREDQFGRFEISPEVGVSLADFELICAAKPDQHQINNVSG